MQAPSDEVEGPPGPDPAPVGLASWRWNSIALLVFLVAILLAFAEVWRADPRIAVPAGALGDPSAQSVLRADVTFEAWLVYRNAVTLIRQPTRLFDAEHCAPWKDSLTLGVPMITLSALAVPIVLFTDDPVLSYNLAIVGLLWITALAMYLVVSDWTGVPAAGIAAGLLFAVHPIRLAVIHHPTVNDTAWTVLGLFFAHRLFARGRWRDALGLALACGLQVSASFYPMLVGIVLAPVIALWLLRSYSLRRVGIAQLALVVGVTTVFAAVTYGPYLEARASSALFVRSVHFFAFAKQYLPGGTLFVGWWVIALVVLGVSLGRKRAVPDVKGDPRWVLLTGALAVAILGAGPLAASPLGALLPDSLGAFNPYTVLAQIVPGLDTARGVFRLGAGVHLVACIVAGMGVAACVRLAARFDRVAALVLIALSALAVLRAPGLGWERPYAWVLESIRPPAESVAFFRELEDLGNGGPLFELPFDGRVRRITRAPPRILLTAYHGRRTSACFGSYKPPGRDELEALAGSLSDPQSVSRLRVLGFTTVVSHHPKSPPPRWAREAAARSEQREAPLRLIHATDTATAFGIVAPRGDVERTEISPEPVESTH